MSFSGLIAAAVFATLDNKHGMHGWQWLFIIEGVVTVGIAFACIFMLPDTPLTTRWLSPEERQLAYDRIQNDTVGLRESKGAMAGFMQALRDPRLYLLVFMQNMHLSATSFNQFFPTVVKSLGFNTTITLVLTAPPSLVAGAVGILVGISSGKYNDRTWHITIMMGIAVVGFVISATTLNVPARYVSCFLFASGKSPLWLPNSCTNNLKVYTQSTLSFLVGCLVRSGKHLKRRLYRFPSSTLFRWLVLFTLPTCTPSPMDQSTSLL